MNGVKFDKRKIILCFLLKCMALFCLIPSAGAISLAINSFSPVAGQAGMYNVSYTITYSSWPSTISAGYICAGFCNIVSYPLTVNSPTLPSAVVLPASAFPSSNVVDHTLASGGAGSQLKTLYNNLTTYSYTYPATAAQVAAVWSTSTGAPLFSYYCAVIQDTTNTYIIPSCSPMPSLPLATCSLGATTLDFSYGVVPPSHITAGTATLTDQVPVTCNGGTATAKLTINNNVGGTGVPLVIGTQSGGPSGTFVSKMTSGSTTVDSVNGLTVSLPAGTTTNIPLTSTLYSSNPNIDIGTFNAASGTVLTITYQ